MKIPFAKWRDFGHCVQDVMKRKGFSKERAQAYCAVIKRKTERMGEDSFLEEARKIGKKTILGREMDIVLH